ncbi:hypothetical protein P4O66_012962, partial [Electrophorus voltai]
DPKVGFGFAVSGGRDKPNPSNGNTAVVISDVLPSGPAMGRLQTRDHIVMVNGVSMETATSLYTIQHLKSCGKMANITVKRPRTVQIPSSSRPTRAASHSNLLDGDRRERSPRRISDSGYDQRPRSSTLDRNGHDLPIMSGFKRLPYQDVPEKPISTTLIKKKPTDEYGMKLGSQIFIKHMTSTGLAAKEGTLQEGDLVLKINGMTTENLSLLETKHLVEKSRGKLTMVVLRDSRKFLVNIPVVEDSPQNSADERHGDSSSELEQISDLDSDDPTTNRTSRSAARERRTRRNRAEAPPASKSRDATPLRSALTHPPAQAAPARRVSSESESDHSNSPPPAKHDALDNRDRYRVLSGVSALPNPRASPISYNWNAPRSSASLPRPRRAVSESDSDRSASPPARRDSPKTDKHSRYKVLPDIPPHGLKKTPISRSQDLLQRGPSPYRPPPHSKGLPRNGLPQNRASYLSLTMPWLFYTASNVEVPDFYAPLPPSLSFCLSDESESESDGSSGPPLRQGTPSSQDSRNRYRATPAVLPAAMVEPQKRLKLSSAIRRGPSESESEESYTSVPRTDPPARHKAVAEKQVPSLRNRADLYHRAPSPVTGPPAGPSTGINSHLDHTGICTSPSLFVIHYLSHTSSRPYSSDQNTVRFLKEGSVGLRLVGGNDVGTFVGGVQPNSPAQKQGMKEGDQILQVNGVDFSHFTREEAAMFLMNVPSGEHLNIITQNKMDLYKKIMKSSLGDSFYIRTHFDHEQESPRSLNFTRGEVFRVVDTMYHGKLGTWLAIRMGSNLHELEKGTIPNQSRAETLASMEQAQRIQGAERQASAPRAEFWKLRGLRGAKKNVRRTRDDLLQLTIQGKFPAYEKVLLREANFKRPIVIMGPLNDIANEKLAREMPSEFEIAEMVPRSGGDASSSVIKLDTVRRIAEQEKHPLLDITPTAVERLSYIQYHPMVLFLDPQSRKDVKTMRQRYSPNSNKSSRKLYAQALKLRKHYGHLFAVISFHPARIELQPMSNVWYEIVKEKIRHLQSKPVWVSEVALEGGGEEELDALSRTQTSDYLSGASDYEDTDGEVYTDGEAYTDNEDLEEPMPSETGIVGRRSSALARSSEPAARPIASPDLSYRPQFEDNMEEEPEYATPPQEVPPLLHVGEPRPQHHTPINPPPLEHTPSPTQRSFSDSDFSVDPAPPAMPSEGPPDFRAPDPNRPPTESPPPVTLSAIEKKLQETRMPDSKEKAAPAFIVLAHHHEAMMMRRNQIRGSDSSDDDEDDDENDDEDDMEWGPATEL